MSRISKEDLKRYLERQGITGRDASRSIKTLRKIDENLKQEFMDCFQKGIEPEVSICNITYQELVSKMGMNMIQAFLYLDWLKREPELALDTLDRVTPMGGMEEFNAAYPLDSSRFEDEVDVEDLEESLEEVEKKDED